MSLRGSRCPALGRALQTLPAPLGTQAAPAHLQLRHAVPPHPAGGPVGFSRLDPVGEPPAAEHRQGAEQEEGGTHGSAAPSPPGRSLREKAKMAPASPPEPLPCAPRFLR